MYTVCYGCGVVSDIPLCRNCLARGLTSEDEVERTGIGSDFKVGDEYYEVKSGDAELSPRQEREKRRRGDNFHEVRYDNDVDY